MGKLTGAVTSWIAFPLLSAACDSRGHEPPPAALDVAAVRVERPAVLTDRAQTRTFDGGTEDRYVIALERGASRDIVVTQDGVDVVVELIGPDGTLVRRVDSPNGRHGDERLELVAQAEGTYVVVVRPLERGEPGGAYRIAIVAARDPMATAAWLAARAKVRAEAAAWLRTRAGAIAIDGTAARGSGLDRFDRLARRARVVGLGEATHGSRQHADLRLALTRRLVERHGVRVIGLEASAARMRAIDRWARRPDASAADLDALYGTGWINRRVFLALADYVRTWNLANPRDPVTLLGLDDQDNAPARDVVEAFAARALDEAVAARTAEVIARIAKADRQATVFGPSEVDATDWRFLRTLHAGLETRRAVLAARYGAGSVDDAIAASRTLAQFAEFNAAVSELTASRDRMMAMNLVRALGPATRAAYWGHNAHVAHPSGRGDAAPAGALLAESLGPEYAAIATAFVDGGFLAQLPNDPGDRLQTFALPAAAETSIDGVLATVGAGDLVAAWPEGGAGAPAWLAEPQPLHWIGALWAPESSPDDAYRATRLVADYDGVVLVRHVDAETSTEIGKNRAP